VTLFDFSRDGCKIEFVERPDVGERVWVKFESFTAIEATVRWVAGHVCGVQFERTLHEAIFEHIGALARGRS
jgi:hypothetical protein